MVYVLNQNGQPLMPTKNYAKVRVLLKQGKAKVVNKCPFTIQLLYSSTNYTQKVTLGVDSGSKHIGVSATIKDKVLFEADVELRNDIVDSLSTRRELRRSRRNRKTRYRKPRFNNRRRKDGWLAPSVKQNHIESRKTGSDAPNNLITLCETCHKGYHKGTVKLPKTIHRGMSFRDATFMGVMRWAFYNKLKKTYPNVSLTYGYITKNTRIENGLPKDHYIDARCIGGNPNAVSNGEVFYYKKVRCHNRQIHKCKVLSGGIRKRNQATYYVMDYRMYDKVSYQGKPYIVFGRRNSGFFDIRTLDGTKVNKGSISYKKIRLIEPQSNYIVEKRTA